MPEERLATMLECLRRATVTTTENEKTPQQQGLLQGF